VSKRILVVDDDADFRAMLRSALEIAGYSVNVARDGRMALAAQRHSPADILITDIFMPDSDGFEAIDAFRKNFPATRIIAISGGAPVLRTNYLDAAGLIGVDAALQKPFEMDELLKVLRTLQ
jgi:CheY-like chemotaxis protein